jgi:hypothetical protein
MNWEEIIKNSENWYSNVLGVSRKFNDGLRLLVEGISDLHQIYKEDGSTDHELNELSDELIIHYNSFKEKVDELFQMAKKRDELR